MKPTIEDHKKEYQKDVAVFGRKLATSFWQLLIQRTGSDKWENLDQDFISWICPADRYRRDPNAPKRKSDMEADHDAFLEKYKNMTVNNFEEKVCMVADAMRAGYRPNDFQLTSSFTIGNKARTWRDILCSEVASLSLENQFMKSVFGSKVVLGRLMI